MSTGGPLVSGHPNEGTGDMIVLGTDPHKQSHTAAALDAQRAECVDELTVKAREAGHERLLGWARSLDGERVWAIEDCRHVSGGLERFLRARASASCACRRS
jgi:transposase